MWSKWATSHHPPASFLFLRQSLSKIQRPILGLLHSPSVPWTPNPLPQPPQFLGWQSWAMAQFYSMSEEGWHQLSLTVRDTSMGTQREESEHRGSFYFLWNKPNKYVFFSIMKMSYPEQWLLLDNASLRCCFLILLGNHDQIRGGSPCHPGEQRFHCSLCFQRAVSVKE